MKKIIIFIVAAVFLSGCGASTLTILRPVSEKPQKRVSLKVNEVISQVPISQDDLACIRNDIIKKLHSTGKFESVSDKGGIVALDIKVTAYDAGDRAARYLWGPICGNSGEGKISLEAAFINTESGVELSKITTYGTVTAGFLGGSFDIACSNATQKLVQYAVDNFGK